MTMIDVSLEGSVTFASFGLPTPILKGIRASGLTEPTAIQSKAIPIVLQGNDLIGVAQSGSGKSGAYLMPILSRLLDRSSRLRGIVLVPTRELAQYVETRARDYARFCEVQIGVVFTGTPLQAQERMLRENTINLLVATPGRLIELHARGAINFEDVEILVLEEADRMVALGLAPDLRKLLKLLPETRQTLLFTLTMPPELNRLAKEALVEPVRVDVAPASKPSTGITQAVYPVNKDLKPDLLDDMLARAEVRSTIVFTRAKTTAERLARQLRHRGYAVAIMDDHGSAADRDAVLEDLRRGRVQIAFASDTSARGLDVAGTAHVINVDVPGSPEEYVHRLGRGGRGEPVGDAFTLMSPEEQKHVDAIERFLGRAIPRVVLPDFDYAMVPGSHRVVEEPPAPKPAPAAPAAGVKVAAARIAERRNGGRPAVRSAANAVRPATNGVTRRPPVASAVRPHKPGTRPVERARPGKRPAARRPAAAAVRGRRTK